MPEYRADWLGADVGAVRVIAYVRASTADAAKAKLRQFLRARVPVSVVEGPGIEVVFYLPAELADLHPPEPVDTEVDA